MILHQHYLMPNTHVFDPELPYGGPKFFFRLYEVKRGINYKSFTDSDTLVHLVCELP